MMCKGGIMMNCSFWGLVVVSPWQIVSRGHFGFCRSSYPSGWPSPKLPRDNPWNTPVPILTLCGLGSFETPGICKWGVVVLVLLLESVNDWCVIDWRFVLAVLLGVCVRMLIWIKIWLFVAPIIWCSVFLFCGVVTFRVWVGGFKWGYPFTFGYSCHRTRRSDDIWWRCGVRSIRVIRLIGV